MYTTIFHFIRYTTRWTSSHRSLVFPLIIFRFFALKSICGTIIPGTTLSGTHLHYFHSHSLFTSIQSFINLHSTAHHITDQRNAEQSHIQSTHRPNDMHFRLLCWFSFFWNMRFWCIGTAFKLLVLREARERTLNRNFYIKLHTVGCPILAVECLRLWLPFLMTLKKYVLLTIWNHTTFPIGHHKERQVP